ncbi:GNAT family N-acetyltransferase [Rhodocytophaga aerolata]|uniref:GNAT family N-acetyltransferase n=1 Tax=Rhodocytophaga aerolata TaxID=455078 RepID=A0ABT8R9X6_9BACT|nr:GNAT family N-acetyltransferase [Rhodocytophaga aerolata]MDO1448018.1 GNAT family N-acetyltransferase [Rhodocytophaga aerolata]
MNSDMIVTDIPQSQIKKANESDVPVIIDLAKATWEPTYQGILSKAQIDFMFNEMYAPAALKNQMVSLGHTFLILYIQNKPAGYASYSVKPENDTVYKLQKLYLLPELHGKGIGKLLIKAVEDKVQEEGGKTLELNVNRYNPARAFYERVGFVFYKEEDIPIGDFWMNDFVMRKRL